VQVHPPYRLADFVITYDGTNTDDPVPFASALDIVSDTPYEIASRTRPSRTVSILGKTHSGKTDLVQRLLASCEAGDGHDQPQPQAGAAAAPGAGPGAHDGGRRVDAPVDTATGNAGGALVVAGARHGQHHYRPTSSGITAVPVVLRGRPLTILDFEGEDAGGLPTEIQGDARQWEPLRTERNAAVKAHLPRIAYSASDVVMLLTRDHFAAGTAYETAVNFASRCTSRVQSPNPALVLVCNFMQEESGVDMEDIDETTRNYLDAHDQAGLLSQSYGTIKVVHLPARTSRHESGVNLTLSNQTPTVIVFTTSN
jgi:hypothetical protein